MAAAAGYKAQVQKSPHDPLLVFEYVYSTYRAAQLSSAFGNGGELVEAEQALDLVLPTHTYEFARLHFLIAAKNHPSHALKALGERLLKHNPDDVLVKWQMGSILQPSTVPAERQQALNYADDLIHRSPGNPDYYANLAGTYYDIWLGTKKPSDGEKAAATYRTYLNISAKDAPFRKRAQSIIDGMPAIQAYWNKKKGT